MHSLNPVAIAASSVVDSLFQKLLNFVVSAPAVAPSAIMHLFNPPKLEQFKRARGRPRKDLLDPVNGTIKHALSDDEPPEEEFTLIERNRFMIEYNYETNINERNKWEVIRELAPLYNISYKLAHDLISP